MIPIRVIHAASVFQRPATVISTTAETALKGPHKSRVPQKDNFSWATIFISIMLGTHGLSCLREQNVLHSLKSLPLTPGASILKVNYVAFLVSTAHLHEVLRRPQVYATELLKKVK